VEATKGMKNVFVYEPHKVKELPGLEIPPYTKPEWYFSERELKYVENLKNHVIFHPMSSDVTSVSRNISFDLIERYSNLQSEIVMVHGGRSYLPESLKELSGKIKLLWEDFNCFEDEDGHPLGKLLALTSECKASVHGWSGSFTMSMGFNKPYVVVTPSDKIRNNSSAPYRDAKEQFLYQINRARNYGCLDHSAWCITDKAEIVSEAVNYVQEGKTGIFNKTWTFI